MQANEIIINTFDDALANWPMLNERVKKSAPVWDWTPGLSFARSKLTLNLNTFWMHKLYFEISLLS